MMGSEILWRLWSALGIAICGVVLFFLGRAYEASKMKDIRKELRKLRKQNEMIKKLSPKLKWGENENDEKNGDYLPKVMPLKPWPHPPKFQRAKRLHSPMKKKEIKLEIATHGDPRDA
jgi:hypothetical protein